ncbi:MAG: hypothetical protein IT435_04800 [Phycisphaerales bacterium]|nr:hypothetical protein [Phycisphaerales bacterium]
MFPQHIAAQDDDRSWDVSSDAPDTELMVIVDYTLDYFDADEDNDVDMFDVLDWTQRGFVLAAQSSQAALVPAQFTEYMKRVYDFGTLINRRDFNGDGVINSSDLNDFDDQYALYSGQSNCNWVHGDVNGDHQVTLSDATAYHWWYAFQGGVNPPNVANLGNANPDNALTRPD